MRWSICALQNMEGVLYLHVRRCEFRGLTRAILRNSYTTVTWSQSFPPDHDMMLPWFK